MIFPIFGMKKTINHQTFHNGISYSEYLYKFITIFIYSGKISISDGPSHHINANATLNVLLSCALIFKK